MSEPDLVSAVQEFLDAEVEIHNLYPNTATCRSGPGVVAGQAFTRHCGVSCSNPVHIESANRYHAAKSNLYDALEEFRNG